VGFDFRVYTAWFYLGQVECTLGEFAAGRRSLAEVDRLAVNISEAQRPIVSVLVDYQRAMCSWGELQRAGSAQRDQLARQTLADLTTFIGRAEAMSPVPREVQGALADARQKADALR